MVATIFVRRMPGTVARAGFGRVGEGRGREMLSISVEEKAAKELKTKLKSRFSPATGRESQKPVAVSFRAGSPAILRHRF
jgi:hypothetical protein